MKVKELIEWLKKQDPESIVGRHDIGQDSGDWYEAAPEEIVVKKESELKKNKWGDWETK